MTWREYKEEARWLWERERWQFDKDVAWSAKNM